MTIPFQFCVGRLSEQAKSAQAKKLESKNWVSRQKLSEQAKNWASEQKISEHEKYTHSFWDLASEHEIYIQLFWLLRIEILYKLPELVQESPSES